MGAGLEGVRDDAGRGVDGARRAVPARDDFRAIGSGEGSGLVEDFGAGVPDRPVAGGGKSLISSPAREPSADRAARKSRRRKVRA